MGKGTYNGGSTVIGPFFEKAEKKPKKITLSELAQRAERDALAAERLRAERDAFFEEINLSKRERRAIRKKTQGCKGTAS